jgi:hypothetical protein
MPTLPAVQAYDPQHLVSAATYWDDTAAQVEDAVTQYHSSAMQLSMVGQTADALHNVTRAHLQRARNGAEALRQAAMAAGNAADELRMAKQRVLNLVEHAVSNGFSVSPDYTVTDEEGSHSIEAVSRAVVAQQFSADLRRFAVELFVHDSDTATKIARAGVQLMDDKICDDPNYQDGINRGFWNSVIAGIILGGMAGGVPTGGAGFGPGAVVGGATGGIGWFIHQIESDGPKCQ